MDVKQLIKPISGLSRSKKVILAVVAIGVGIAGLNMFGNKKEEKELIYSPYTVEKGEVTTSISGSGTLEAAKTYNLTASVTGDVLSDDLQIGDSVSKGQVLYVIDDSDAQMELSNANLSLKERQLSAQQAQDAIADLSIYAPISGLVKKVYVEEGSMVNSGMQVFDIIDEKNCTLKLAFNHTDVEKFNVGDAAKVILVTTGDEITGKVKRIGSGSYINSVNAVVRDVEIEFDNNGRVNNGDLAAAIINGIAGASEGSVEGAQTVTVMAKANGTMDSLKIHENDYVNEGDLLAVIENDNTVLQGESTSLSLENARLNLQTKEDKLENYVIEAPCDGTVLSKSIQEGDTISSAGTQLAIVADLSSMKFTMNIDELDISKIAVGQDVIVTADATNQVYQGKITAIVLNGTTNNGVTVYPVEVTLEKFEGLLPGMNVSADIITQASGETLRVPINCVSRNDLLLIDEKDAKNFQEAASLQEMKVNEVIKSEDYPGYYFLKVESGVSNNEYTQILTDIPEGLTVYSVSNSNSIGFIGEPNMMENGQFSGDGQFSTGGSVTIAPMGPAGGF